MPKIIEDEQIFTAVIQTIAERGYAGATTRQMAEAAGVSEVTLFRKYENKLQLVRQAITALVEQTEFESAICYTGDLQADLVRVLKAYQGSVVVHRQFFAVLFTEITRDPELANSFAQPLRLFDAFGQLLARYQAEGLLRPEPPRYAVAALLGPLIYLAVLGRAIPESRLPPLDLQDRVLFFLEGHAAHPGSS